MHIVNPVSQDDLFASINGACQNQEPWLGYMWATGSPALLLDLVRLEDPRYSDECWATTKACAYEDAAITIGTHSSLPDEAPDVVDFLRKWGFRLEVHLKSATRWQAGNPDATIEDMAFTGSTTTLTPGAAGLPARRPPLFALLYRPILRTEPH